MNTSMKRALAGVGSLAAVVAVAGALLLGSQALRGAHLTTADVIDSPSPTPIVQNCITPDNCPSPEPACVPGEGTTCDSSPAPINDPTPTAAPSENRGQPPAAVGVPGEIQVSAVWFIAGTIGITVAVLYDTNWVAGADVSVHCTGPGYDARASGTTAASSSWIPPSNLGPQPPKSPAFFFWAPLSGNTDSRAAAENRYVCHGTATYNGLSGSF